MAEKRAKVPDRRLWLLMAGTVLTLVMAALVKGPCLNQSWDGAQYRDLCYNDVQPLYGVRSFDEKVFPYVGTDGSNPDRTPKGFLEYPVLTGIVMFLAALPSSNGREFFFWNAAILSFFALATTLVLYRTAGDPRRVAFFAAGPPLILYAFHNWDLVAVFFSTLGLYAFGKGRWILSGISLGLGAAAKIYPAFFVPILGLALLGRGSPSFGRAAALVASSAVAFAAVNAPFILMNPALWWMTYSFHISRGATVESPWFVMAGLLRRWGWADLGYDELTTLQAMLALPSFAVLIALIGWSVWRGRLPPIPGCLATLLVFLLANKVWSVQFLVWVLPFFALLQVDWKKFAAIETADVGVYATIFPMFLYLGTAEEAAYFNRLAVQVLARTGFLVWLLVSTLRTRGAPASTPVKSALLRPCISPLHKD